MKQTVAALRLDETCTITFACQFDDCVATLASTKVMIFEFPEEAA